MFNSELILSINFLTSSSNIFAPSLSKLALSIFVFSILLNSLLKSFLLPLESNILPYILYCIFFSASAFSAAAAISAAVGVPVASAADATAVGVPVASAVDDAADDAAVADDAAAGIGIAADVVVGGSPA